MTLCAVLLAVCLRGQQKDLASLLSVAAVIVVFTISAERVREAISFLTHMAENHTWSEIGKILIKALGISALSRITADICTQAGESTLAGQIEIAGALEITLLSLPLATQLLEIAGGLLS